jgi:hypothetical protein
MFDIHLLRCIHKALVLLATFLDVEGIGAHKKQILHVFECGFQRLRVLVVDHPKGDPSVFELFAVCLFRGCCCDF